MRRRKIQIMKVSGEITDKTTSLQLSKELSKLGSPQESLWYWYEGLFLACPSQNGIAWTDEIRENSYSAYLDSELLKILPQCLGENRLNCIKTDDIWRVEYVNYTFAFEDPKLSEALGLILRYLYKNKLVKSTIRLPSLEKIKKKLKRCYVCKTYKSRKDFFNNNDKKRHPDGKAHDCKVCSYARKKAWRKTHKENRVKQYEHGKIKRALIREQKMAKVDIVSEECLSI